MGEKWRGGGRGEGKEGIYILIPFVYLAWSFCDGHIVFRQEHDSVKVRAPSGSGVDRRPCFFKI